MRWWPGWWPAAAAVSRLAPTCWRGAMRLPTHASADRAFDARVTVLAALVGDDGLPPWMVMPGVGVLMGETVSIRIDGEISKKDIGDGYGLGAYAGIGFSGKGAAIASGVIAAIGLSLFAIAVSQLGT
jgi:hypothetical protein